MGGRGGTVGNGGGGGGTSVTSSGQGEHNVYEWPDQTTFTFIHSDFSVTTSPPHFWAGEKSQQTHERQAHPSKHMPILRCLRMATGSSISIPKAP